MTPMLSYAGSALPSPPLVITQRGRGTAVLLSMTAYEKAEHERELLRLIARGEKEITEGAGFDLDDGFLTAPRATAPPAPAPLPARHATRP